MCVYSYSLLTVLPISIMPLFPHQVARNDKGSDEQARRSRPPHNRVPSEVVLGLAIGPAAHAQPEVEPGPVRGGRCEDVFLVRIRDESIV